MEITKLIGTLSKQEVLMNHQQFFISAQNVTIAGEVMNEYKFIDLKEINENVEDGKYLSYGTVLDYLDNEVIFEENPKIKFLSIFKLNKGEFLRFFFSKDKNNFTIDLINKLQNRKFFNEFLEKFKKIKI